ncbi:MAG: hypothetical protein IRY91_15030 [Gemmatimonadaceae bacterium]|nr:hypothetical protein [Gemmatimonadaceae bacterium]
MLGAIDRAGVPYMLTGSIAASYYGAPRGTQDIDVVVAPTGDQLRALVAILAVNEYYVDEDAALEAQRHRGQFNVIDLATGWKVDVIMRKERPFSQEEFDRRTRADFEGLQLTIATIEDLIIAKLEWARLGQSQRQIDDIARLLEVREGSLDRAYLARWVQQLGLQEQWTAACRKAERPTG